MIYRCYECETCGNQRISRDDGNEIKMILYETCGHHGLNTRRAVIQDGDAMVIWNERIEP